MKTLNFISLELEHTSLCSSLDSLCFESEVFSEEMIFSLLKTPFVFGFLATEGEEAVGYALASHAHTEGDLLTVCILPEKQGKGYGKQLLNKLFETCKTLKMEHIFLEVRPSNTAAIALYESYGATHEGKRKNYYTTNTAGVFEDALVMKIKL